MGLAPKKGACNRNGTPLLSSVGSSRNSGESETVDTIYKKQSTPSGRNTRRVGKTGVGRTTRRNSAGKRRGTQAGQARNRANAGDSGGEEAAAGRKRRSPKKSARHPLRTKNEKDSRCCGGALEGPRA